MKRSFIYGVLALSIVSALFCSGFYFKEIRAKAEKLCPLIGFEFTMPGPDGPVAWRTSGPIDESRQLVLIDKMVSRTPDGKFIFSVKHQGLVVKNMESGISEIYEYPIDYPRTRRKVDAISYSPQHDVVLFVGGIDRDRLYRFDFKNRKWIGYAQLDESFDICLLQYDPYSGNFMGLSAQHMFKGGVIPPYFFEITVDGECIEKIEFSDALRGVPRNVAYGMAMWIVPFDSRFAILAFERTGAFERRKHQKKISNIWVYNRSFGFSLNTY